MTISRDQKTAITPAALRDSYVGEWRMSPGMLCNGFLFLTGMTGTPPDGVMSTDNKTQIRQCFENINLVLAEAEMNFTNVVEMTSYHINIEQHFDSFKSIRSHYVMSPYPAWTAVEVSRLINPLALIEVRIIASAT